MAAALVRRGSSAFLLFFCGPTSPSSAWSFIQMLLIHLALGADDIPQQRQGHTLLPTAYYLRVREAGPALSVIGLTGLYRRLWDDDRARNYWLGWFVVDPAFQGQGLGERLLGGMAPNTQSVGWQPPLPMRIMVHARRSLDAADAFRLAKCFFGDALEQVGPLAFEEAAPERRGSD
jgi:GNAT superfamily N-acetyltransferase